STIPQPPPTTAPPTTVPPSTEAPTTTTAAPPATSPPSTEPPTSNPAAAFATAGLPPAGTWTEDPYRGLGVWVAVYDWTETSGGGAVGVADVDRMAALGAQTLFIQATRWDAPTPILEQDGLVAIMNRAHERGLRVVAWYLPDLGDINDDLDRTDAIARLPIDG